MSILRTAAFALALLAAPAHAQGLTALARVDAAGSRVVDDGDAVALTLALSRPVPWRVFTLDAPRRLVLDFSEVAFDGLTAAGFDRSERVTDFATGALGPGWSRLVLALDAPLAVSSASMQTGEAAELRVELARVDAAAFSAAAGAPAAARFTLPEPAALDAARRRQDGSRPVLVALDPGHGGIDPGAEAGGVVEAELMLTFARELADVLRRAGFAVVLTREADVFVPLEARQSIARAAGADVFISLHADALSEGRANGATVYTLSDDASDIASEMLAERHERGDLLAGVDLANQDDEIAGVLMDLARAETAPRSDRLADALVAGLRDSVGTLYKHPRLEASFSVLKAADLPSVLVELGFLSSLRDRERLTDAAWRGRAAAGIAAAVQAWAAADAAEAALLRQ